MPVYSSGSRRPGRPSRAFQVRLAWSAWLKEVASSNISRICATLRRPYVPRRARDGSNQGALLTMNCHQRAPATRKEALTDAVRSMDGTSASRLQPAGPASTGEGRQKAERTRSRRPARHRPAVEGVPRRQNRTLVKYAAPCTYTCNRSLHS